MAHTEKIAARRAVALSVVVPCYNEIGGVAELYRRVTAVCREQAGHSYEIVLVIDGSTDGTREAIFELAEQDSMSSASTSPEIMATRLRSAPDWSFAAASASSFSMPTFRTRRNCSEP